MDVPALRRFLESPLAEEMRQAETAAREYRFTVLMPARDYDPAAAEEDSILLQGVVDCWFETPKGVTVVDFKTDFVQTEGRCGTARGVVPGQLAAGAGTGAGKGGDTEGLYFPANPEKQVEIS